MTLAVLLTMGRAPRTMDELPFDYGDICLLEDTLDIMIVSYDPTTYEFGTMGCCAVVSLRRLCRCQLTGTCCRIAVKTHCHGSKRCEKTTFTNPSTRLQTLINGADLLAAATKHRLVSRTVDVPGRGDLIILQTIK
jgi:hypothetical protein